MDRVRLTKAAFQVLLSRKSTKEDADVFSVTPMLFVHVLKKRSFGKWFSVILKPAAQTETSVKLRYNYPSGIFL